MESQPVTKNSTKKPEKILLVQAFTAVDMELVYPIGLGYLAAHLPSTYEIKIIDVNTFDKPYERLREELLAYEPDIIGLSLRNIKVGRPGVLGDDFRPQQRAVEEIKRTSPTAFIVVGGTAFSLYAQEFMRRLPQIDVGIWGEAEERFPQLLANRDKPWETPGVYWRNEEGEVKYSGVPSTVDFKTLKPPRRDLVDPKPYIESSFVSVGLQGKRGCALHCIHCSDTFLLGHRIRMRPAKDIVDEMQDLVENHGCDQLFFCDQIFNIPPKHAIDICKEIVERGLKVRWSAWFNEHRNTLTDELMIWLKKAGCGMLSFSPDHVDDRMLKNLDKNFRYEDMVHTYTIAKKHDLDVEYSFFLNSPGEDLRSLLKILKFIADAKLHLGPNLRMFTLLLMQPIRIYPHTRLAELAQETGLIDKDHGLIEGQYWNPNGVSWAVTGIQKSASLVYDMQQRWRKLRGTTGRATVDR
jgi:anaerobic magnesium-protoporphyrin IX monomethyl ester cyclase